MSFPIHQELRVMVFNRFINWIISTPSLFDVDDIIVSRAPFTRKVTGVSDKYEGNPRLGFIYQTLCSRLFAGSEQFKLLAEEIQINQDGKTVGAIDFIVENMNGRKQHWEVAIKFYLLHGQIWYGPNQQDRLDKKLTHMLNHQLPMSSHPQFIGKFPEWQSVEQRLLMQGRLYINPFSEQTIPETCCGYRLNQSQINGFWCYRSQMDKIKQPLYLLEKHQWATGADSNDPLLTGSSEGFVHCQAENGEFWFIMPDSWPQK